MAKVTIRLYPSSKRYKRKDQVWGKKQTVPNQSMSLQEIIRRFTRKEALPLEKDGVYEDRFGDLEKLSREDITVRRERAAQLKDWAKRGEAEYKEKQKKSEEEAKKKSDEEFEAKVKGIKGDVKDSPPDKPNP